MKRLPILLAFALCLGGVALADPGALLQKTPAPEHISHGERISLSRHLVPGKTVIFDFTSRFCPPCQRISPLLDELHAKRDDLVVVKVDINRPDVQGIDWKSPVAQQFELHSIPEFKIFGPDGQLVAVGDEASEIVRGWLEPAPAAGPGGGS